MFETDIELKPHPDLSVTVCDYGEEKAPLLIIDNLVEMPEVLIEAAARAKFAPAGRFFPGVRAMTPPFYQLFLMRHLREFVEKYLALPDSELKMQMCHFSLVTTPPSQLGVLQRIPHFDSLEDNGLATVHYLFKSNLGGTAFYRHRKTGYESITESRREAYFRSLESENDGPNMPEPKYICGDTALYEQIKSVDAAFNRMIVYRRNSLHSGSLTKDFCPDPSPLTGRLSINSFVDLLR